MGFGKRSGRDTTFTFGKVLQRRFDPDSMRQLYVAELNARTRHKDKNWATFGDVSVESSCRQSVS